MLRYAGSKPGEGRAAEWPGAFRKCMPGGPEYVKKMFRKGLRFNWFMYYNQRILVINLCVSHKPANPPENSLRNLELAI